MASIKSIRFNQNFHPFTEGQTFNFGDRSIVLLAGDQGCGKSTLLHMISNYDKYTKDFTMTKEMEKILENDIKRANIGGGNMTLNKFKDQSFNKNKLSYDIEFGDGVIEDMVIVDTVTHNPQVMNDVSISTDRQYNLINQYLKKAYDEKIIPDEFIGKLIEFTDLSKKNATNYIKDGLAIPELDILTARMKSHGQAIIPLLDSILKYENSILLIDEPENGLSIRSQYRLIDNMKKASKTCQIIVATHSMFLIEEFNEVFSLEHNRILSGSDFIKTQKELK